MKGSEKMKEILKKVCMMIIIGIMIINVGCSKKDNLDESYISVENEEEHMSFDEAIETSNCIISAEFVSYHSMDNYIEYEFQVKEVLYGDVQESNIYLFSMIGTSYVTDNNYTYNLGDDKYKVGNDYILIMEKSDSLFYEHVRYMLVTDIFIPINKIEVSVMYEQPILDKNNKVLNSSIEIEKYIKEIKNNNDNTLNENVTTYIKSNDMNTIVSESDFILEIEVNNLEVEGLLHNGNTYICEVIRTLKGDSLLKDTEGKILVTLLKDSVEVGSRYIVMINKVDEESIIYTQSSESSIIPIADKDLVNKLNSYID